MNSLQSTNGHKPDESQFKQYSDGVLDLFGQVITLAAEDNINLQPLLEQTLTEVEHLRRTIHSTVDRMAVQPAASNLEVLIEAEFKRLRTEMAAERQSRNQQTEQLLAIVEGTIDTIGALQSEVRACQSRDSAIQESIEALRNKLAQPMTSETVRLELGELELIVAQERAQADRLEAALRSLTDKIDQPELAMRAALETAASESATESLY